MSKQILALSISAHTEQDRTIMSMINQTVLVDASVDIKLFTTNYQLFIPNKIFSVFPIYEAKYISGAMVVWDLLSLELSLDFPNITSINYLQSSYIPWENDTSIPYKQWSRLFDNPKVKVITDNQFAHEIFSLTWKTPTLIENTNPETLYGCL